MKNAATLLGTLVSFLACLLTSEPFLHQVEPVIKRVKKQM